VKGEVGPLRSHGGGRKDGLPDGVELGGSDLGVAAHQGRVPGQSGSCDDPVREVRNCCAVNPLDSFSHVAVKGGQLVGSVWVGQRYHEALASGGRQATLLDEVGELYEADRGTRMESPAADALSKAFAAAEDSLGLLVRYQTAACVSATTVAIRSHSGENSPPFPPGLVDLFGAQVDIQIGPKPAPAFPGLPRLCCLVVKVLHVIQDLLLLACGKRPDRIENRSFQSHRKTHPANIIHCFWPSEKGKGDAGPNRFFVERLEEPGALPRAYGSCLTEFRAVVR